MVEADGAVRPCFFHEPIGNIREQPLAAIVASELRRFRQTLDVETNPICGRCVCSTKAGWRNASVAVTLADETRRAFDSVAADYHRSNVENVVLRGMRERTLAALLRHVPPASRLLDLGCGPGTDAESLAALGYRVTAVDASPAMVDEARRRVREAGLADRVAVHHAGLDSLDALPPAGFDAAYSNFGPLNCVADLQTVARGRRRGACAAAACWSRRSSAASARGRSRCIASRGDLGARPRAVFARAGRRCRSTAHGVDAVLHAGESSNGRSVRAGFRRVSLRALGLLAPPPYLQAFAERHPGARATRCSASTTGSAGGRCCAAPGDHFLIVLRKAM